MLMLFFCSPISLLNNYFPRFLMIEIRTLCLSQSNNHSRILLSYTSYTQLILPKFFLVRGRGGLAAKYQIGSNNLAQRPRLYTVIPSFIIPVTEWKWHRSCLTFSCLMTYICRTAPLTSRSCILYIYSTNIRTEYFKHAAHSPVFPLQNTVYFIMLPFLVPVLFTF